MPLDVSLLKGRGNGSWVPPAFRPRNHADFFWIVMSNPYLEIRQASDSVMLAAEDYLDSPDANGPKAVAKRTLAEVKERIVGADGVEFGSVNVGTRAMPHDGLPIIGFDPQVDGLYVTVMHAGVTLAPVVGRLASTEILDDVRVSLLEPCRAQRFLS